MGRHGMQVRDGWAAPAHETQGCKKKKDEESIGKNQE